MMSPMPDCLRDVLAAATSGLDHLVHSARAGIQELFAEPHRGIVDDRRCLKARGVTVTTTWAQFLHGFDFSSLQGVRMQFAFNDVIVNISFPISGLLSRRGFAIAPAWRMLCGNTTE